MTLLKIALQLRTLHFYAQAAHHRTCGPSFYSDHAALDDLYTAYADAFDTVVETAIGNQLTFDEQHLNLTAAQAAQKMSLGTSTPEQMFGALLQAERILQSILAEFNTTADLGDQNLAAQLAQDSKTRASYKIAQRLKA